MATKTVDLKKMDTASLERLYHDLTSNYTEARDCGAANVRSLSASIRWVKHELEARGVQGYPSAADGYAYYTAYRADICGA